MLYDSLGHSLKFGHDSVENILLGAEKELLIKKPEGKWSIHDNIAHLARYQTIFIKRINTILETELPVFERYSAEADPEFERWQTLSYLELLNNLKSDRADLAYLIMGLNNKQLNRKGVHRKYGELNIVQWTEFFLLHEAHHLYTIFLIRHLHKNN